MNKWTLKFNDIQLEQKYQEEQRVQQINTLGFTLLMSSLSCLVGGIYWVLDQKYIVGIQLILGSICSPLTYYFVVHRGYCTQYVDQILWSIHVIASLYQLIPFIYIDLLIITQLWFTDLITLMITQFTASSNLMANLLLWTFFLSIKFGVRYHFGFCLISISFSLFVVLSIYNDYQRVKTLRQIFLLKAKNFQTNNILDEIVTDNLVTLQFNEQLFRFHVLFTNNSFLKNISQDAHNFLKSVLVVKNRVCLLSTIYEQIKNQLKYSEFEGKINKQRYYMHCLVQYFDDIIITINIHQINKNSIANTLQFPFYKAILNKVKQSNKKLYFQEKIKHLLAYILYAPHLLDLKIMPLQSRQLNQVISKYCYNVNIEYEKTISSIILLIDVYFYLLVRIYHIQRIQVHQQTGYLVIDTKLIRKKNKTNILQFNKFKKNIMDLIATQNSTIEKINLLDLKEIAKSQQFRIT